jgi:hypothetical protein
MVLVTLAGQIQKQKVCKMLDKLMVISLYALPTVILLVACLFLSKKK